MSVHGLLSLHTTAVPPHDPPEHVSFDVHALPSLHGRLLFVKTQPVAGLQVSVVHGLLSLQVIETCVHPVAGLHESVVQALLSLQLVAVPPWHVPPEQTSFLVHALPSLHEAVLFV